MREHPLAVLDFPPAEAPGIPPVQPGRVGFEADFSLPGSTPLPERTGHEANDHEAENTREA